MLLFLGHADADHPEYFSGQIANRYLVQNLLDISCMLHLIVIFFFKSDTSNNMKLTYEACIKWCVTTKYSKLNMILIA